MRCLALAVLLAFVSGPACRPSTPTPAASRQFPLTGDVLAIKADRTEITVKHDEVKGFMDAMTMPFAVKDGSQLEAIAVGDRIAATLVVTAEESYLTGIRKTGSAGPDQRELIKAHPR